MDYFLIALWILILIVTAIGMLALGIILVVTGIHLLWGIFLIISGIAVASLLFTLVIN